MILKGKSFEVIDVDISMNINSSESNSKSFYGLNQLLENKEGVSSQGDISSILAGISKDSMLQGLVYSEIFGMPKCRRRGR